MSKNKQGFTLIEMMVVIVIIGILATLSLILFSNVKAKANDTKRKSDLAQLGQFLTASCYLPDAGAGTYDLITLFNELKAKDEKYQQIITKGWRDPKSPSESQANYFYLVDSSGHCALYANLENSGEPVTLPTLAAPTAGGGNGVLTSITEGINGTNKYFQVSN